MKDHEHSYIKSGMGHFDKPFTNSEPKKPPAPVKKIVFILYSLVRFIFL